MSREFYKENVVYLVPTSNIKEFSRFEFAPTEPDEFGNRKAVQKSFEDWIDTNANWPKQNETKDDYYVLVAVGAKDTWYRNKFRKNKPVVVAPAVPEVPVKPIQLSPEEQTAKDIDLAQAKAKVDQAASEKAKADAASEKAKADKAEAPVKANAVPAASPAAPAPAPFFKADVRPIPVPPKKVS